jgi:hypothetical protein
MGITLAARRARGLQEPSAPKEGVGNAGCPVHPQPRVRSGSARCTRVFTAVAPEITRHPRTQWFYGLCRALPGDRAFLSPSPVRNVFLTNLTPASRRQDHTILPSASKALSSEAHLAATASNPASVTIAIRPSSGVDGCGYKLICDFGKPEYFFRWDWTGQITLIRLGKLDFRRKSAGGARGGTYVCHSARSLPHHSRQYRCHLFISLDAQMMLVRECHTWLL